MARAPNGSIFVILVIIEVKEFFALLFRLFMLRRFLFPGIVKFFFVLIVELKHLGKEALFLWLFMTLFFIIPMIFFRRFARPLRLNRAFKLARHTVLLGV